MTDFNGGPGDDTFAGGTDNDNANGNDGNDTLWGNDGADTLTGGAGEDQLNGGAGEDSLYSGDGNDTIHGDAGDDVIYGGNGINTVYGDDGNDYIQTQSNIYYSTYDGGDGRDTIDYSWLFGDFNAVIDLTLGSYVDDFGNETVLNFENVLGTQGSETIIGTDGANTLNGYDGNDVLKGLQGADILNGGAGNDTIDAGLFDASGADTVDGGDGDDYITSSGAADVQGGLGNDTIVAGFGASENLDGGDGIDTLDLTGWNGAYVVNMVTGVTGFAPESFINFENIVTGAGNDDITGTSAGNRIDAGAGADIMRGGDGGDTYAVDNAGDVVIELSNEGYDDVLATVSWTLGANLEQLELYGDAEIDGIGNALDNAIFGNSAINRLSGLDGNDWLNGGAGGDVLTGGAGDDTYIVDNTGDIVVEGAGGGTDLVLSSVTWVLGNNVENLTLTGSADTQAAGNSLDNQLTGNGGNNRLDGVAGADTMAGGGGDDTYVVDQAGDVVIESEGEGVDEVRVAFSYTLGANVDNLVLTGAMAVDGTGNNLNNMLTGNVANNRLNGGSGADTVNYMNDTKGFTANLTTGVATGAGIGNDTLSNIENLLGGSGNDTVTGSAASNWLDGGKGADTLTGLAGNDTYVVDNAGDVVVEAGGAGTDVVNAWINYSLGSNVERLNLMGTANIAGTGNGLDNQVTGNSGNNKLDGGIGADTLIGGLGNDSYYIENAGDKAAEAANEGIDQVYASINFTLGSNVENLQLTGSASNGTGNGLNNVIWGTDGANLLDGKAGADKMLGGLGDDTYYVDNSSDQATDIAGGGVDTVVASQSHILSQYVENLVLTGSANITATGNAMDNVLLGNTGNNRLTGGLGADEMDGSAGNDTYYVDNTGDVVVELVNYGVDLVQSTVSFTLSDNVENLYLNGSENLNGTGNALNNLITGTSGNNVLDGGAGVDKLFGGLGDDTYYLDNSSDSAKDELNGGNDLVYASASWVMTAYIENLVLTGSGNITGTGNALNNAIAGNAGNNKLDGGTGDDLMAGGLGNDTFVFNLNSGMDIVSDFTTADTINLKAYSHGTAFGGGITVVQSGSDVLIDLGGGNMVTVSNSLRADVVSHIGW